MLLLLLVVVVLLMLLLLLLMVLLLLLVVVLLLLLLLFERVIFELTGMGKRCASKEGRRGGASTITGWVGIIRVSVKWRRRGRPVSMKKRGNGCRRDIRSGISSTSTSTSTSSNRVFLEFLGVIGQGLERCLQRLFLSLLLRSDRLHILDKRGFHVVMFEPKILQLFRHQEVLAVMLV